MTKGELQEVQKFLEAFEDNGNQYIDDIGVFESILTWLRKTYREQAPKKLGDEFNKGL